MMIQFLSNFIKRISIISVIGSNLMIITISQAGGPPPDTKPPIVNQQEDTSNSSNHRGKPVKVEPKTTKPTHRQSPTQQSETTDSPPDRIRSDLGLITLRLINQTGAIIEYQVIGGQYMTLGGTSVVELSKLSIPLTLTYQRPDGGLILVRYQSISPTVLEVIFHPTEDFDLDTNSLNISGKGQISLN
ncbi:hypothetical protein Tery_3209 [Trichodesmium erythraeum IMS101]|uniref:Uncharacterized protein n=2 Tax=Trichodesmium erythraeum TaxID=1206 RepID=Q10ZJ6_TRIEI